MMESYILRIMCMQDMTTLEDAFKVATMYILVHVNMKRGTRMNGATKCI